MKTEIEVKKVMEHYEIYYHGEFYCSCDTNELSDVIRELDAMYMKEQRDAK